VSSSDGADIGRKLDEIISILQLAFRDQIESARQKILADPVAAAILDAAGSDGADAGQLQQRVATATNQSTRTVQRRIAALIAQGAIAQSGSGARIRYRSTNLL